MNNYFNQIKAFYSVDYRNVYYTLIKMQKECIKNNLSFFKLANNLN